MSQFLRLQKSSGLSHIVKTVLVLVLLIAILSLGRYLEHDLELFRTHMAGLGIWAYVLFILIYPLLTSFLVPDTVTGFAVGATFGLAKGMAVGMAGAVLSALVQYLLARSLLRPRITQMLQSRPKIAALQSAVLLGQYRIQFLIRLLPVNRAVTSYALGAGGVTLASFLTSCLAFIPHVFIEVYMGFASTSLIHSSVNKGTLWHRDHVSLVLGILVSVLVLAMLSRLAKRTIDSAMARAEHP